jgi:arylformamidase
MQEKKPPQILSSEWIDVSVTLREGMLSWPGDPKFKMERRMDMGAGDEANVSLLTMSSHTGTHMDAPLHFLKNGRGLDEMPLGVAVGPARVIGIKNPESITRDELIPYQIGEGERILFKTANSLRNWPDEPFREDYVHISTEAALFLARRRVRLVGVDYLSVSQFEENEVEVHRTLLEAGVWIIEGLNLAAVEPGRFDLICLPLKIANSDGAPARVILRAV